MAFFITYGLLLLNIIAFCLYGLDKRKAERGKWRISEPTLFFVAIMGGSVGSLMAMQLFHHKTQKNYFRYGIPAILIVQATVVAFLLLRWLRSV